MKHILIGILAVLSFAKLYSQETFPINDVLEQKDIYVVFKNANIHIDAYENIKNGVLVIKDDKIVSAGKSNETSVPKNSIVYDLKGKHIYPSFIDLDSDYGMPSIKKFPKENKPYFKSKKEGSYNWNEAIKPEINAIDNFIYDKNRAKEIYSLGFGAVATHQKDGIMRGTSVLVSLGDEKENKSILKDRVAQQFSFDKGSSTQDYPSSLTGAIALIRQTYYDAKWHAEIGNEKENNISLKALNESKKIPLIFDVNNVESALRAKKLSTEFGFEIIVKGNGDEYKYLNELKKSNTRIILPLTLPFAYDMSDPDLSRLVDLKELKHWEISPSNAKLLFDNTIEFAFTLDSIKDFKALLENINIISERGLAKEEIFKALTENSAKFINAQEILGTLKPNLLANFIICEKEIFDKENVIYENWIKGKKYLLKDYNTPDIAGTFSINFNNNYLDIAIQKTDDDWVGEIVKSNKLDTNSNKVSISLIDHFIALNFKPDLKIANGLVRLSGNVNSESRIWDGAGIMPDGKEIKWSAIKKVDPVVKQKISDKKSIEANEIAKPFFPNMAFGLDSIPNNEAILLKNGNLWTNEPVGILYNTSVLIYEGKIKAIGNNIDEENIFGKRNNVTIKEIDCAGKNITPGIIDEHSHIAISEGANESGQACSAEVRIADVVDAEDINIYRQLAGGVTCSQLLHGSSNPIGGQSAIIKLKWGLPADSLLYKNAKPFIKFALGENVKESNWGDNFTERFPQTRMGIEQFYFDYFNRAKEYSLKNINQTKNEVKNNPKKNKKNQKIEAKSNTQRVDLELEALAEILDGKRFITCHSYVQSEVNMLIELADSMKFKVNTFTHILEGYKLADKIKLHGAAVSTFSDWWAYKFEVKDATPYNSSLLSNMGLVTAVNSDDAEMGRRLNQEAAKAIKYGGLSQIEALKLVTLNPAKMLHIGEFTGSLKIGKDADLVVWSSNPLSIDAKVEKTFIEGICYYSIEQDDANYQRDKRERSRISQKMLLEKAKGKKVLIPSKKIEKLNHCDTIESTYNN
jgi:imidazolonepropionase-like amidohydrolase